MVEEEATMNQNGVAKRNSKQQINLKNNAAHTPRGWLHRAPSLPLLTPRTSAWSLDGPLASAKR